MVRWTKPHSDAAVGDDGQSHAPGVAAILPLVLRGAGLPVTDFDGSSHQCLVVNAPAFITRPAADPGFIHLDMLSRPAADPVPIGPNHARAKLVQNAEGGFVPGQPELPLKLHRRHARRLAGNQIGGPEPGAQGSVAALHDRADGQSGLPATRATSQYAGPRGDAERFAHDVALRTGEPASPASPLEVGGAGRVVGKKSLKLGKRSREWQIGAVDNVHGPASVSRPPTIRSGCMRQPDRHG